MVDIQTANDPNTGDRVNENNMKPQGMQLTVTGPTRCGHEHQQHPELKDSHSSPTSTRTDTTHSTSEHAPSPLMASPLNERRRTHAVDERIHGHVDGIDIIPGDLETERT